MVLESEWPHLVGSVFLLFIFEDYFRFLDFKGVFLRLFFDFDGVVFQAPFEWEEGRLRILEAVEWSWAGRQSNS